MGRRCNGKRCCLADEVDEATFRVLPPLLPCAQFGVCIAEFLGVGDVADRCIEPHVEHFALCSFYGNRDAPVEVACYGTRAQTSVEPRPALAIYVWSPFLMLFQNPLLEPRLVVVERKVPVLGRALHERIASGCVVWIDEFVGRKCGTTFLTLVAVCLRRMTTRTFATNVAVGEELMLCLVVVLFAFEFYELAFVVELAEEVGCKLVVNRRSSAAIDVERNAEVGKRFLNQCVIAVHHILWSTSFFLGADGDWHTVLVATTDEQYALAFQAKIACIDVGRHIHACEVSDVDRTVGVGESRCDKRSLEFLFHEVYVVIDCFGVQS